MLTYEERMVTSSWLTKEETGNNPLEKQYGGGFLLIPMVLRARAFDAPLFSSRCLELRGGDRHLADFFYRQE